MAEVKNVHVREIGAPASEVGEVLDTLGSVDDRLWATDIWVAEPVVSIARSVSVPRVATGGSATRSSPTSRAGGLCSASRRAAG